MQPDKFLKHMEAMAEGKVHVHLLVHLCLDERKSFKSRELWKISIKLKNHQRQDIMCKEFLYGLMDTRKDNWGNEKLVWIVEGPTFVKRFWTGSIYFCMDFILFWKAKIVLMKHRLHSLHSLSKKFKRKLLLSTLYFVSMNVSLIWKGKWTYITFGFGTHKILMRLWNGKEKGKGQSLLCNFISWTHWTILHRWTKFQWRQVFSLIK